MFHNYINKIIIVALHVPEPDSTKRFDNNLKVGSTIKRNNAGNNKFNPKLRTKVKGKEKAYDNKGKQQKKEDMESKLKVMEKKEI